MKDNLIKKLTSRKFIVTAISTIAGLVTLFVGNSEVVQIIASAAMIVIPTIVYCITEGAIDAQNIKTITDAVVDTAEKLGVDEKKVDVIEQMGALGEVLVEKTEE